MGSGVFRDSRQDKSGYYDLIFFFLFFDYRAGMFLNLVYKERREQSASDGLFKGFLFYHSFSNRENAREMGSWDVKSCGSNYSCCLSRTERTFLARRRVD